MEELAVFNWPGLDQKAEPFTQTALAGELVRVEHVRPYLLRQLDKDERLALESEREAELARQLEAVDNILTSQF